MRRPNPLWVKSPLLLLRFKGLMVAVVTGALLLALASSSFPLFMSATESSSLDEAIQGVTNFGAGVQIVQDAGLRRRPNEIRFGAASYREKDEILRKRFGAMPHVGPGVQTILGPDVSIAAQGRKQTLPVRLVAKTDWESHVTRVAGDPSADGVWIADTIADSLRIEPGDDVTLTLDERTVGSKIAGTYEALAKQPVPEPYWLSSVREIYPSSINGTDPPPFVLVSADDLTQMSHALNNNEVRFTWEFPLADDGITLPQARSLADEFALFQRDFADVQGDFGRKFSCFFCRNGTGDYFSLLPTVISEANRNVGAIRGPVNLLSIAGVIVALTVIASTGAFTMARRRTEASLLFARGSSALMVGAKAALESIIPVALGAALGFCFACGIVLLVGPPGDIDRSAIVSGIALAALGVPVAVLLMGVVASLSYLRHSESATATFRKLSGLPWELVVLAIGGYFLRRVLNGGALIEGRGDSVERPSVYLLLFPIFFIGGAAGLGARLLQAPLRALVRRSGGSRPSSYLALHRLAGTKRLAILLVTAAALSLGILIYSQTVVTSLTTTIDAKSTLFVGSDVQATISYSAEVPDGFPYPATKVTKLPQKATLQPSGTIADVIVVDSDTLAGAAYWSDTFAGKPLEQIAEELATPAGDALPALLVGKSVPESSSIDMNALSASISAVDTATNFPGATLDHPALVVDRDVLDPLVDAAGPPNPLLEIGNATELWIKGPPGPVVDALNASGASIATTLTAEEVRRNPRIIAVTRTFGYLKFLGFGAGLLAIVAVLMYLQARQRNRVVSFALARRMGLTDRHHRIALIAELAAMLLSALALAIGLALVAARLIFPEIDPLPATPPGPLFQVPWSLVAGTFVALVGVALGGGLLANRSAERADFAEVMRLAA
jgi:putative ABC transport system permease protein